MTVLIFLLFVVTLYIYWLRYTRRLRDEPPPIPYWSLPFIGHMYLALRNTTSFWKLMTEATKKCTEMGQYAVYFIAGPYKYYVLIDPDDIETVSNTCLEKDKFTRTISKQLLGDGLIFSTVPTWKRHRKLIQPAFNQQILDSFIPIFNKQGRRFVKSLEVEIGKGWFDQSKYVEQIFMETICLTALDDSISPEEVMPCVEAFHDFLKYGFQRARSIWLYPEFTYKFSNLKKMTDASIKVLHDMSDKILKKKRALRKLNDSYKDNNTKFKVFMDLLMDLDGDVLTDQEIRDEMNTIIVAGYETSATMMIYILVLIGSYPKVQERLYEELRTIFGNTDRDIEKQDLSQLVYMEAVIKESMRIYVLGPLLGRHVDREVKLKTCTLKPGHNVFLGMYGLHRHPMWGQDADEFKPERWLNPATLPKHPHAFGAFSIGKRNCIGKTYSMMSMKSTLIYILRHYKLHADHTKLQLKLEGVLKPSSGYYITIADRRKL